LISPKGEKQVSRRTRQRRKRILPRKRKGPDTNNPIPMGVRAYSGRDAWSALGAPPGGSGPPVRQPPRLPTAGRAQGGGGRAAQHFVGRRGGVFDYLRNGRKRTLQVVLLIGRKGGVWKENGAGGRPDLELTRPKTCQAKGNDDTEHFWLCRRGTTE